jgi:hypothetical protein
MSRIETLKKQFPHLNITLLDILSELDGTKSHKYLQLLCKILSNRHTFNNKEMGDNDKKHFENEINNFLSNLGFIEDQDINLKYIKFRILEGIYLKDELELFTEFKNFNEKGIVGKTDLTKYSNFSDIMAEVSLCNIKETEKFLEKQIVKEFENDTWLVIRPLSFEASSKYGSGTKWCTTFKREKDYFFKYFHNGSLVYFINKKTGYKVAMHGVTDDVMKDITFWDSLDNRRDSIELDLDDCLVPTIKSIVKCNKPNSWFLDLKTLHKVAEECNSLYRLSPDMNVKACEPDVIEETRQQLTELMPRVAPNMRA